MHSVWPALNMLSHLRLLPGHNSVEGLLRFFWAEVVESCEELKKKKEQERRARSAEQHFPTELFVKCYCLVFLLISAEQTKNQLDLFPNPK